MQQVRLQLRRHGRITTATLAPLDDLAGLLANIAEAVMSLAAATSAGAEADFANRMDYASRAAPRHMVAAIIAGLKAELRQALAAIAQNAAMEIRGRQKALILAHSSRMPLQNKAARPAETAVVPALTLASTLK